MATPDEVWSASVKVEVLGEENATNEDVDAFHESDQSLLLGKAIQGLSLVSRAGPSPAVLVAAATSPAVRDEPDASRAAVPPAQSSPQAPVATRPKPAESPAPAVPPAASLGAPRRAAVAAKPPVVGTQFSGAAATSRVTGVSAPPPTPPSDEVERLKRALLAQTKRAEAQTKRAESAEARADDLQRQLDALTVGSGHGADMEPAGPDETEKRRAEDPPAGQQPPKRANSPAAGAAAREAAASPSNAQVHVHVRFAPASGPRPPLAPRLKRTPTGEVDISSFF